MPKSGEAIGARLQGAARVNAIRDPSWVLHAAMIRPAEGVTVPAPTPREAGFHPGAEARGPFTRRVPRKAMPIPAAGTAEALAAARAPGA